MIQVREKDSAYYESLGRAIDWYRSRDWTTVLDLARWQFDTDCRLVLGHLPFPPKTWGDMHATKRAVVSLLFRKKYKKFAPVMSFKVIHDGTIFFAPEAYSLFLTRYAHALWQVTPDTEYLIQPVMEFQHVVDGPS